MKKILTVIVCLVLTITAYSQGGVVSSHNLPSSIAPGQTIDVEFTLNKGTIGGFAKFQMDLPFGFNAVNVDSKQGNFTFENQRVKIVWVSLPSEPAFTFTFKIMVPSNALNMCQISAKFFYLENNVKKEVEMPTHTMKISGSGDVASTPTNTVTSTPTNTVVSTPPTNTVTSVPTNTVETTPTTTVSSVPTNTVETTPTRTVSTVPTNTVATTPTKTVSTTPTNTVSTTPTNTVSTTPVSTSSGTVYKVQLGAFSTSPSKSKFPGVNLSIVEEGGFYKALSGSFTDLEQAKKHQASLNGKGYDCIIAIYENGRRTGIVK